MFWYGAENCMTSTANKMEFEDARLQSHLKKRVFKIFNHGFLLSNPRKAKIQTIGFQALVENAPDDPERAT
jgi:hypothetical protein